MEEQNDKIREISEDLEKKKIIGIIGSGHIKQR